MALEEVGSRREARELLREYRREAKADRGPVHYAAEVAGVTGGGAAGVVGEDSDGLELDPGQINEAVKHLDELYALIATYQEEAQDLAGPLGDGRGPVAAHMRQAFGLRGSATPGGVQKALEEYLEDLARLRDAIAAAGAVHRASDEDSASDLQSTGQGEV